MPFPYRDPRPLEARPATTAAPSLQVRLPPSTALPAAPRARVAWTRAEIALFKGIHGTHTDEELARFFERSLTSIRALAEDLRLAKDKAWLRRVQGPRATRMPRWTRADIRLLREQYATSANLELARKLRRSVASVVSKARLLGLKKSQKRLSSMGRENVSVRYSAEGAPSER